jgi:hypothetical protein
MKTLNIIPLLLAVLVFAASKFAFANDRYVEAMQKNIEAVYKAQTPQEIQNIVNSFERIGETEKTKWEPYYYAAYGYLMMALREKESAKIDNYLDQALKAVGRASALNPAETEVIVMEGFVHMIRVTVDPASRGQQFSGLAFQSFGKAVALNPENPRALALLAQMQYGTAQFFGASTKEACETLAKSLNKFDSYKSDNPLAPQWGKGMAEEMKSKCN